MTYYIDYTAGSPSNTGLTPDSPLSRVEDCTPTPGDTVYIKRGSRVHSALHTTDGTPDNPITYAAYGDESQPKPTFNGAFDVSGEENWTHVGGNIWKTTAAIPSEPGNIIFNGGKSFGNLRWSKSELDGQGEWYDPNLGKTESGAGYTSSDPDAGVYLYSADNPGKIYGEIELALYGERKLAAGSNITLENLAFRGSGVHGFASHPKNTKILGCDFLMIGGCVWNRERKIRFGNAIEFWEEASNITVSGCLFMEIYDSCVTHQGFRNVKPMSELHYDNNTFINYGMAAYEQRDLIPVRSSFNNNVCIGAGLGFAAQGEAPPRQSEIYPQPMGHHIFMWRTSSPSPDGYLEIKNNVFYSSPVGAAIYSINSPTAEDQVHADFNIYADDNKALLIRWSGRNYTPDEFAEYQSDSGMDRHSAVKII